LTEIFRFSANSENIISRHNDSNKRKKEFHLGVFVKGKDAQVRDFEIYTVEVEMMQMHENASKDKNSPSPLSWQLVGIIRGLFIICFAYAGYVKMGKYDG